MLFGTVTWFDPRHRMALVQPDAWHGYGTREILVHADDLDAAGLPGLHAGQRVVIDVTDQGPGCRLTVDGA